IDYMTSSSTAGISTITAYLRLNYDSNRALTEISAKVNSVINQLPPEAQQPRLELAMTEAASSMFVNFNSDTLSRTQITDYLTRTVRPKIQTLPGVQSASLAAGQPFALRAWLDQQKLAAYGLTGDDVYRALGENHYVAAIGSTLGQMNEVTLKATTDLQSLEDFRQLVVKQKGDSLVRLQDVARVVLGGESYESSGMINGKPSVAVQINVAPDANLLEVNKSVRAILPEIIAQLPPGIESQVVYDASVYVDSSIREVVK